MEPAASVAFAGLFRLLEQNIITPQECVVVNCSGHTFSAEKHALEDRHAFHLQMSATAQPQETETPGGYSTDGLVAALEQLDEQITTIVIIDDNPHDSRLIRRLLMRYKNYRIFEAHSGPEGLDLVRQWHPGLIVCDLTLPGMDGFSIVQALKADERTREIPIVIVSAKNLSSEEWERLRSHTQSIWQKGNFGAQELVSHVVRLLGDEIKPLTVSTPSQKASAQRAPEVFGDEQRPRILVIDENISDARLMRRLFEARHRFEITEVHSGQAALDTLKQFTPDLIVLDLMLSDIPGEELLNILRSTEQTRSVPVIVVTAQDIDPALRTRLSTCADSIWLKGAMDRSSLLAHVEMILPG